MAWREEIGADTILDDWEVPEVMRTYYPGGILGRDRDGDVVIIDAFGRADLKGVMMSVKRRDIMKTTACRVEMAKRMNEPSNSEQYKSLGDPPNKVVYILDMTGFSSKILSEHVMKLIGELVRMLEDNYPETLKKTYFINAPTFFIAVYDLVKRFLNKDTASKCKMLGTSWHAEVFKIVPPTSIPKFYGGEMIDSNGDPKCSQIISYGGDVPTSCYQRLSDVIPEGCELLSENIGIRRTFSLPVHVVNSHSAIRWIFATEKGELVFSITKEIRGKMDTVLETRKLNCDIFPEDGVLKCSEPGKYCLKFENANVVSKKKLMYFVEVFKLEDQIGFSIQATGHQ